MPASDREARRHDEPRSIDQRTPAERDRDRILYSSALRRLVGVTQVVDPAEGHAFHNRLLHTFKVAQIGRRLAQKLLKEQPEEARALGEVDPEVVEAAALAHDLGHPPFGHIAERELDELLRKQGDMEGFEGNAQSFRILTKLAFVAKQHPGLNLTRATLNATLKYPWRRQTAGKGQHKWGAYYSERPELEWARQNGPRGETRCVEAELMDWADDITYAVHDLEDFYRAVWFR
ncbi:MAG: dNTP triphosphohydrolase [Thermoanaerobaculia bacterium]|nr:dNTP triphosphohydrolase [Thermoanaerobaculia bacterium]